MRKLIVFVLVLAATGCRSKPSETIVLDPALVAFVPADAVVIGGIKMDALRKTAAYQKLLGLKEAPRQLDEFTKETGLDPRKDIWELFFASNGKEMVGMARGKFSPMGEEPRLLEKSGAKRFGYKSYLLIGNDEAAVTFTNATTALFAKTSFLKQLLDARDEMRAPRALLDLARSIPSKNQIWAATVGGFAPLRMPEESNLGNLNKMFGSLERTRLGLDLSNGVALSLDGYCTTPADAKRLHDTIRGFIGIGRLTTTDNNPDLLRFYDGVNVKQKESTVEVTTDIPLDLFEKVLAIVSQRGSRPPDSSSPRPR